MTGGDHVQTYEDRALYHAKRATEYNQDRGSDARTVDATLAQAYAMLALLDNLREMARPTNWSVVT